MADRSSLVDTHPVYIGGQWVESRSGRYDDISPSTEQAIAQAPEADLDDVDDDDAREGGGLPGLHRYMEPKAIGTPV